MGQISLKYEVNHSDHSRAPVLSVFKGLTMYKKIGYGAKKNFAPLPLQGGDRGGESAISDDSDLCK